MHWQCCLTLPLLLNCYTVLPSSLADPAPMTPKLALEYCRSQQTALEQLGRQATQELREGDLRPDDDDDAGWDALLKAEQQVLDAHRVQCGSQSQAYREVEAALRDIGARLETLGKDDAVSEADLAQLKTFGQLMEKRPPCEDRGWFVADLDAAMPVNNSAWLDQLVSSVRVSLRLPSTTAQLRVSDIELTAEAEQSHRGLMAKLRVRFQAYMHGRQGDSLTDMLKLAQVRLALPNRGPLEMPLQAVERVESPAVAA